MTKPLANSTFAPCPGLLISILAEGACPETLEAIEGDLERVAMNARASAMKRGLGVRGAVVDALGGLCLSPVRGFRVRFEVV